MAGTADASDGADDGAVTVAGDEGTGLVCTAIEDNGDIARHSRIFPLKPTGRCPNTTEAQGDVLFLVAGGHDNRHVAQTFHAVSAHSR
jgi:hypothetical protein